MEVEEAASVETAETGASGEDGLYAYTKRQEFTSENFKIEVRGLPKYYGLGEFKKLLQKTLSLNPHKLKPLGPKTAAIFVAFKNEDDRREAIKKLNGFRWKKNELSAFMSSAAPDPYMKKKNTTDAVPLPATDEELKAAVTKQTIPLFEKPYDEQLTLKRQSTLEVMKSVGKQLSKANEDLVSWWVENKKLNEGALCPVETCLPSPVTEGYRNKCEFTVGLHAVSRLPTVGFRLSSYKAGSICVAPVDHLAQVSATMKKIVKVLEVLVRARSYPPYDPVDHSGNWKTIMVRTNVHDHAMVCVGFHCQALPEAEIDQLKKDIVDALQDTSLEGCVKSVYFKIEGQASWKSNKGARDAEMEHINGDANVEEILRGLKFRISPKSFFQCNTAGAEVLYNTILRLAKLKENDESYLIDVCCGTGTIGIYAADLCRRVIGVDIVREAVDDARHNAEANGLGDKMEFACGPAETMVVGLLKKLNLYGAGSDGKKNIVAIVDPPRAGLHRRVIGVLRREEDIRRLVYVSCDAKAAAQNFVDLGRSESNQYPGEPFVPTLVVPVDLYPHTEHTELVLVFERVSAVLGVTRPVPVSEPEPELEEAPVAGSVDGD